MNARVVHDGPSSVGGATTKIALGNFVARGIGLLVSLVVAALLQPEGLGQFALMVVSASFFGSLGVLGFAPLATRAVAHASDVGTARDVASFVLKLCVAQLAVLGLLLMFAANPAIGFLDMPALDDRQTVSTVAVWGLMLGINPLLVAIAAGHGAYFLCSLANVTRAVLVGVGTTAGCLIGGTAADAAVGAAVGECLVAVGVVATLARSGWLTWRGRANRELEGRAHLVRQAATAGAASLTIQFSVWISQIMLARTEGGVVATGAFLLASRLLLVVTLVPNALAMTALPMLADRTQSESERRETRRRILRYTLISAAAAGLLMGTAALLLLPAISGEYLDYRPTVAVMAIVGIVIALNNVMGSVAVAERRIRTWIRSDWVLAICLLGGAAALVPRFGSVGLAVGYFLAYTASVAFLIVDRRVDDEGVTGA